MCVIIPKIFLLDESLIGSILSVFFSLSCFDFQTRINMVQLAWFMSMHIQTQVIPCLGRK